MTGKPAKNQGGATPKPTALKILEGNPGKRPINDNEPRPTPVAPPMPRGLLPEAQRFWKAIAPKLEALGVLTAIDGPSFRAMATHYAIMIEAEKKVKEDGLFLPDKSNGGYKKNAAVTMVINHSAAYRRYAAEFGMTPAARTKLSVPDPVNDEGFFGY